MGLKKKKSILKHSLHVQLISERKRINVLTWFVNGGFHESNTLGKMVKADVNC